jgi:hypothetical protein
LDGLLLIKRSRLYLEEDDSSSKLMVLVCGIVCYLSGVYWVCS